MDSDGDGDGVGCRLRRRSVGAFVGDNGGECGLIIPTFCRRSFCSCRRTGIEGGATLPIPHHHHHHHHHQQHQHLYDDHTILHSAKMIIRYFIPPSSYLRLDSTVIDACLFVVEWFETIDCEVCLVSSLLYCWVISGGKLTTYNSAYYLLASKKTNQRRS